MMLLCIVYLRVWSSGEYRCVSDTLLHVVIENVIMAASSAPSGAHTQPWFFVAIRTAEMKRSIREAVEREEKENYERRMGAKWVEDLKPFGTSWSKPYLETAPVLIVMFKQV